METTKKLQDYETFKKKWYEYERVEEIVSFMCEDSQELKELERKSQELLNKLSKNLNKNQNQLLSDYTDIQNAIQTCMNYYIAEKVYEDLTE